MIRNGHKLDKRALLAYWLALNDQLEREVVEAPKTAKELETAILGLEERLRGTPNGETALETALEIGRGTP